MAYKYKNFAKSFLASGISDTGLSITLNSGDGSLFPASGASNPFRFVIWSQSYTNPSSAPTREICEGYISATDTITVTSRGAEGTVAKSWLTGDFLSLNQTAAQIEGLAEASLSNLSSTAINTALLLAVSDSYALGSVSKMWSDLFLADGGVINWNNGNVTLTHSSGALTLNTLFTAAALNATANNAVDNNLLVITNSASTGCSRIKCVGTTNTFSFGVGNASAAITDLQNKFYIYDFTNTKIAMTIVPNTLLAKFYGGLETVGNIELGDASDTTISRSAAGVIAVEGVVIPSISSTNTLTNKRVTKRTGTVASSATPTINTDNYDRYTITALAADITSFTTNLSGTPADGDHLMIRIKDDGSARAIAWGTSFASGVGTLPTTTTAGKTLWVGLEWNSASSKWACLAAGSEA